MGKKVPKEELDKQIEKMNNGLNNLEKGFLKDGDFLCGKNISFADLLAIEEVRNRAGGWGWGGW